VKKSAADYDVQWSTVATGSGLPADLVIPGTTRILTNKFAAGDTQYAFRFFGDGRHEWGPGGGGSLDTALYRNGNGILKTDGSFVVGNSVAAGGTTMSNSGFNTGGTIYASSTIQAGGRMFCNDGIWIDGGTSRFIGINGDGIGLYTTGWRYLFWTTGQFKIDHGNAVLTLYDKNFSRGSDRVVLDSGFQANGFLYSAGGPVYCGSDLFIGYSAGGGGDTYFSRTSAGTVVLHDTLVCGGYVQGIAMVYGNGGLSAYDSGNGLWQTWTGYGSGLRSTGHIYTGFGGYSVISSYVCYNRHDQGGVLAGVNDDVKWARDTSSGYVGWRTDQDLVLGKDMGPAGWVGMYVYVSQIGWRRVTVGPAGSGGTGLRALAVNN
jgi:hypothetical protein